MDKIFCPWEAPTNLFFSSNVPDLVHYSHGVAIFAALAIAVSVFLSNPGSKLSKLFLLFSTLFSLWVTLDVVLWATNDPSIVMFAWSTQVLLEPLVYAVAFYLFFYYVKKTWPPIKFDSVIFLTLLPLVLFLPTDLNLQGLLLETCESLEGPLAKYYSYFANVVITSLILYVAAKSYRNVGSRREKNNLLIFAIGLLTFLFTFTSGNIISSFTDDWTISQYGLFGMPFFALMIAYSIVKFQAFQIKTAGAQVLIIILWTLVGSLLLVVQSDTSRLVAFITLIFTTIAGYFLVKSVRFEIKQREKIENLAKDLERANTRLRELDKQKSEFVSIASHQLRSPLAAIRGYASMMLEGSYGKLDPKNVEPVERIADSAKLMSESVEDFLSVSRIEGGNMKYEFSDFNLAELADHITDDLRPEGFKRGLLLLYKSNLTTKGMINADKGKTQQILHNLINNALKYTQKGTITVYVHDDIYKKRVYVDIIDTGIGMTEETIDALFEKFSRAKNANQVNIKGTGLGLFVARQMARAMQGDVTAHSDGEGKGSRFSFEMPVMM